MNPTAPEYEKVLVADSLRLISAFSKLRDSRIRAEIIELAEQRLGEQKRGDRPPFELDSRD
jgi:hypothetical protein